MSRLVMTDAEVKIYHLEEKVDSLTKEIASPRELNTEVTREAGADVPKARKVNSKLERLVIMQNVMLGHIDALRMHRYDPA
jgi:hypothetical protein